MPKRKTYEEVKKVFEDRGYILLEDTYTNAFTPMRFICKKHPENIQVTHWNKIQQGCGCRKCGYETVAHKLRIQKKTKYANVLKKFEKAGLYLLTSEEEYMSESNPIMRFICRCCPDLIQEKTRTAFQQAPHCSLCINTDKNKIRRSEQYNEFVKRCEEKGYIPISNVEDYKNVATSMKYICPKHGEQTTNLSHLREGKGCPICGHESASMKTKISHEELERRLAEKELKIISKYDNLHSVAIFQCLLHPNVQFKARISDVIYSDVKCPACHESKGEKKIRLWLEKHNIYFEPQKRFKELFRYKSQNKLSYDFYIPSLNILIEYQGQFHDGTAWQQTKEHYAEQKIRDAMKKEYAQNNGYNFIEIWYWDYKNIESILEKELNT